MNQFGERLSTASARGRKSSRFRLWVLLAVPLAAILFQVYVPLFFEFLSYMELPLLVTVYFAVMRRSPIQGVFVGASIGLVQDSLSHQPLGMFGIVKTIVGYAAASTSLRVDVEHPAMRFILGFVFFVFHEFSYWVLSRALLGQEAGLGISQTLLGALLNAVVAVPFFYLLDKLKDSGWRPVLR
jgi:rod shape-determining protein MreD